MIRTAIVAGLVGLPLITAAPALAQPNPIFGCDPCNIVQQTVSAYLLLPSQTAQNYANFPSQTIQNYAAFPSETFHNYFG